MARRKMMNTVRTDYLESEIGFYMARRDHVTADALRKLARDVGAPIDEGAITQRRQLVENELARRRAEDAADEH